MRIRTQLSVALGAALVLALVVPTLTQAKTNRIHAERGRQYPLTKKHGPWMIMVASIGEVDEAARIKGLSPNDAALELVYELREQGIPAYTFSKDEVEQTINTYDRRGREARRKLVAQQGNIAVLAGNYPDPDDNVAKKTLRYIKTFHPKVVDNKVNGAVYRPTPGQPGPLSGAFLATNPLLTDEELEIRRRDPLLLKLNSGSDFSLTENPGKYTLIVASFHGQSFTGVDDERFRRMEKSAVVGNFLDQAAQASWEMAQTLRDGRHLKVQRQFEAYVWHDRHRSVVTVGSFDTPNDPRIKELYELFRAKVKQGPNGQDILVSEMVTIPGQNPNGPPMRTWIFDPMPQLMEVPRLR